MPSKGIDVFTWIALDGWRVEYDVPKHEAKHDKLGSWQRDHLEVDTKDIGGLFDVVGDFTFAVKDNKNSVVIEKKNRVNALTGSLEGGDMTTIPNMQSLVRNDCVVTFGFYDSGPGIAGLPKNHMCWVTVTPNWSSWMGQVAPPGSEQAGHQFSTFVLPSAHDVGMNTMQTCQTLLNHVDDISPVVGALGSHLGLEDLISKGNIPKIITALAITQKDTVTTLLQTGARYFEFRPAHISTLFGGLAHLDDKLYFQHAMIPGLAFDQYLHEIAEFLAKNPSEIVVTQIRFDGVHSSCARATDDEINKYVSNALAAVNHSVERGGFPCFAKNIDTIRIEKKRLIILTNAGQYSTYSDTANATLDGNTIAASFPGFLAGAKAHSAGTEVVVWQCQATATNIRDVVVYSVVAANDATSPLLATKPICDQVTLPWLQKHAGQMPDTIMQAVMNDFFDGATADVAIELSRGYLNKK